MRGIMDLTNETLINLCINGKYIAIKIAELTQKIDEINELVSQRNALIFERKLIAAELIRRKCHDIGGALTLIQTNEISADSTEIFDREKNKIHKK